MQAGKSEIRAVIFSSFKLGKSPEVAVNELRVVFGKSAPSLRTVQRWYKRFRDGDTSLNAKPIPGRPKSAITDENIAAVKRILDEQPNATYSYLRREVGIGTAALQTIIKDHLQYRKLFARWVPHSLTEEQKRERVNWCRMKLRIYKNGRSKRVWDIVTTDETWLYFYQPLSKEQSRVWTSPTAPRPTKVKQTRSTKKRMLALFFRKAGFVARVMLQNGQTINSEWYRRALAGMVKQVKRLRPNSGLRGVSLHQDNASPHKAEATLAFLARQGIGLTGHPAYSPDLVPLDFYYNSQIKKHMSGRRFETEKELVRAVDEAIENFTKEDHARAFDMWFVRMQKCINAQGLYFDKL